MEDKELVIQCQEWNLGMFWELYDRYIDRIYKFIYLKTSNQEVAEDISSEVFYKAMSSISWFKSHEEDSSFKAWIYTIANNKVIDFYRTQKNETDIEDWFNLWTHHNFSEEVDNKDKINKIKVFLDTLKADQKEIVILRIWEDLSYKEISEITWKSLDSCKKIVSRSLKNIQANFILFLLIILLF
jgi:RNA polymerase sigma-70 factor (ECF subfamily)